MKNFFKMMLATIAGVIISGILLFFIFLGIVGAIVSSADSPVEVKSNSILKLTFDKQIVERSPDNLLASLNLGMRDEQIGLSTILSNIKKAKTDDNIKGIYLELSHIMGGISSIEEIRNALIDFKKSGKFVIAYSESMTQGAYYLSTTADKIYLNPKGEIAFLGLRSELMFFKGTLQKLGIEPQIIRHGKFKSAIEPFINDKMSDENRLQITTFISTIWNHVLDNISKERNVSVATLNRLANELVLADADSCLSNKMVDSLLYQDQVNEQLLKLSDSKEKEPVFVALSKYDKAPVKDVKFQKNKIAVVYAWGNVISGDDDEGTVASDRIAKALRDARTDSSVKAIVFRINSPGGSALASEVIWREVQLASKAKPVVASMGDLAASGGYYIACAADTIVAQPTTITGSIGVFGLMFNGKEFLNSKLGITTDVAKTNAHADLFTFSRPLDAKEKEYLQKIIEKIYDNFISHVAEGRNMDKQKVDDIAQGRVWAGADAIKIGLVDTLGNLNDAIGIAARLAKVKEYRVTELPKLEDPFDKIMKDITGEAKMSFLKSELGENYKYYQQYQTIMKWEGIQTRLPFEIDLQ